MPKYHKQADLNQLCFITLWSWTVSLALTCTSQRTMCLNYSTQQWHDTVNVHRSSSKLLFLSASHQNRNLSTTFSKISSMKVCKISPHGITLSEEVWYDRTNSHFSVLFVNMPKNWKSKCADDFCRKPLGNRLFAKLRHRMWDNSTRDCVCWDCSQLFQDRVEWQAFGFVNKVMNLWSSWWKLFIRQITGNFSRNIQQHLAI